MASRSKSFVELGLISGNQLSTLGRYKIDSVNETPKSSLKYEVKTTSPVSSVKVKRYKLSSFFTSEVENCKKLDGDTLGIK